MALGRWGELHIYIGNMFTEVAGIKLSKKKKAGTGGEWSIGRRGWS